MSRSRCPRCGGLVGAGADWCGQCLSPLAESAEPAPKAPEPRGPEDAAPAPGGQPERSAAGFPTIDSVAFAALGAGLGALAGAVIGVATGVIGIGVGSLLGAAFGVSTQPVGGLCMFVCSSREYWAWWFAATGWLAGVGVGAVLGAISGFRRKRPRRSVVVVAGLAALVVLGAILGWIAGWGIGGAFGASSELPEPTKFVVMSDRERWATDGALLGIGLVILTAAVVAMVRAHRRSRTEGLVRNREESDGRRLGFS